MKKIGNFLLLLLLILTGIWFYSKHQESQRKKKELEEKLAREREETRKKLFDFYKFKLDSIKLAAKKFAMFLDFDTGYFRNYQHATWRSQQTNLFNELKGKPYEFIHLATDEERVIKEFNNYFINGEKLRDNFNKAFIEEELKTYSSFFDNIEGRKLDKQQRIAVITDEDNNIVIAGAGSGKTTTIVGKVNYIIDRYKVSPDEILLISFTNKSASTLASRIDIDGVEAKTFHKFGKDIIAEIEGKQPSIFEESQFKLLLTRYFTELLKNQSYLEMVTEYFTNFLKPTKSQFEFETHGDYIQYIKDQNFRTYKQKEIPTRGRITYQMEVVKSIEECKIANFLLFNGIDYEYEFPYEFDTATDAFRQYKPDFTIKQNGRKVYLEHFAVSRNGNVPSFFTKDEETYDQAKDRYWEKIRWARQLHEENETTLIETYSYEMSENTLFNNLTEHLTEAGIILRPKSPEEIWQIINNAAKEEVNSFITLFGTFITLMKSNNYSISNVINKNRQTQDSFFHQRNSLFIDIIRPIYERYEKHLTERGEIDFSDMINKASNLIASGRHKRKISYVIIDEFQDISIGRYQLVKAIKTSNPACKLFCVGDDWQSIYRFSGSDIALFKEFENYFGYSAKSKIETTYRFHNPLINLSSDFIQKNPSQARKELRGTSNARKTTYRIHYSVSEDQDDTLEVQKIFIHLLRTDKEIYNKENFILGRYGFDVNRLTNQDGFSIIVRELEKKSGKIIREYAYTEDKWKHLKENEKIVIVFKKVVDGVTTSIEAEYLTVHKAKGLEAENIIILNCNSGKHGFPSEMSDDQVLNLLLSEADQFENGEERRLFYVAMTRAKENVFFVADSSFKSKFISELEIDCGQSPNIKCPVCKTADVVLRKTGVAGNGNTYKFYGCTNYLYGCNYTTTEWINN